MVPATAAGPASSARPASSGALDRPDLFHEVAGYTINRGDAKVRVRPTDYTAYDVDLAGVRDRLNQASGARFTTISVPDPSGQPVDFRVTEDSVMQHELQAAHPEIRTYAGRAADGTGRSVRLDVTPMGFHAFVRSPGGQASWYVDPVSNRRDETRHVSYFGSALPAEKQTFVERDLVGETAATASPNVAAGAGGVVSRRTYRLAFVTDPTYATYFGTGNVMAEKATLINRVNEVYNDDLAIKFVLINDTPKLNLDTNAKAVDPNGPCGANGCYDPNTFYPDGTAGDAPDGCSGALLDRNEFVLGQIVGADKFDIGHIGLGVNGGGIAGLGVVGGPFKADGCTGLPKPDGDFYAVDYVAHEMGHQMGGNHTFNGTQVNCSTGNRNINPYTTQVEPGSGSSVMAYAGICGQDNLQPHSDPYFSFVSIEEITGTTSAAPSTVDERQVVNFAGLDTGEQYTLSCAGCPTSAPVTFGPNPGYAANVAAAVQAVTGHLPVLGDYDMEDPITGSPFGVPSANGFTAEWSADGSGADIPTLTATPVTGTFTSFTGTIFNGGPETNQGLTEAVANHAPAVTAPADKTIPIRTPFTLTGSGSDVDGQKPIYLWEQTDPGGAQGTALVSNTKTDGPLFRVFGTAAQVTLAQSLEYHSPGENLANTSPTRTFPDLAQILSNNTNARTGTCPAAPPPPAGGATNVPLPVIECYSEFLPTPDYNATLNNGRTLNFRLTARDLFATGGGTATDDVALTINPNAGPFLVSSRRTAGSPAKPGGVETVTWDVAGTNTAALAQNVKISLSIDGGNSFPAVLAKSTPNDGSEKVTLPDVNAAAARIKVEAVDNYFFAVNEAPFVIGDGRALDTAIVSGPSKGSFVKARKTTLKLASTVPGSTFQCTLDDKPKPCSDVARLRLRPGTHVFTAAARTPAGVLDNSPARRVFASPFNDTKLKQRTSGWVRHKDRASYRHSWTEARTKGQVLTMPAKRIKKLALVAHTGPGFGRVAIFVGDDRVKTVDLAGKKLRKKVLLKISSFKKPRTDTVRIVTLDNRPVRIDGLGILTRTRH